MRASLGLALAGLFISTAAEAQMMDPRSSPIYRQCRGMSGMSMDDCVCMSQTLGRPENERLVTMLMQAFTVDTLRNPGAALVQQVHAKGIFAREADVYSAAGTVVATADNCKPGAPRGATATGGRPQAPTAVAREPTAPNAYGNEATPGRDRAPAGGGGNLVHGLQ